MGSLMRSEDMSLLHLYFERSAAHATIEELGKLGLVEFNDLNPTVALFQRSFSANVRLCEDMQRRVRFLAKNIVDARDEGLRIDVPDVDDIVAAPSFQQQSDAVRLSDLDVRLSQLEAQYLQMNEHWERLRAQRNQLVELKHVLRVGELFLANAPRIGMSRYGSLEVLLEEGGSSSPFAAQADPTASSSMLNYFAGIIPTTQVPGFERTLYLATRGNCIARFGIIGEPLKDPITGETVYKSVFMLFFSGSVVKDKVSKICLAYDATRYPFPDTHEAQAHAYAQCESRLEDLRSVIETSTVARLGSLTEVAEQIPVWSDKIRREKAIYHTLNLLNFESSNALFIAEVWAPSFALEDLKTALEKGRKISHAQVRSVVEPLTVSRSQVPPTYFKVNKFTQVFQGIVESYGVAEYHEVNPAPFTVITFPFLFAVMFGDIGHGLLMFAFSAYVVLNEKRMVRSKLDEFMQTVYDGRYMLVLMGLFSIFTGFIYNECFAVPLNLFGSRWRFTAESLMACGVDNCDIPSAVRAPLAPYPLGFDPVWKGSPNGLVFFNSYKMKLSIVLGVSQMVLGIVMSYYNAVFHRKSLDVWYVFVPQMIFMNAIFGYLVILILLKWAINWDSPACLSDPNCLPPDIKTILINMFMAPGTVSPVGQLFKGQAAVQTLLLLASLISIPWMLLPKPLILKARFDKRQQDAYRPLTDDGESIELLGHNSGGDSGPSVAVQHEEDHELGENFDFADIFVNQMIHTIEFVLGGVSNTASYLRLWALSLAHAELSDVFLEKLLYMSIGTGNPIAIVVGFFMWVSMTVGVLMFMESLSAFLHALRLHWVEFQNKFYNLHGNGRKFIPFSFDFEAEEIVSVNS
jgi:V-type H+-transporting ATPase subunit a